MVTTTPAISREVRVDEAKPVNVVSTGSEKPLPEATSDSSESLIEQKPHLHAKTYLAVGAVCLIYIAQLVCLVGAGAVSVLLFLIHPRCRFKGNEETLLVSQTRQTCASFAYQPYSKDRQSRLIFMVHKMSFGFPPLLPSLPSSWVRLSPKQPITGGENGFSLFSASSELLGQSLYHEPHR